MRARIYNDNPHTDWKEQFKGEWVNIPSGKFIEMEFYEAHEFKGQFSPIRIRSDETQDPASFKMIRVEKIDTAKEEEPSQTFNCNLCKKNFPDEESLLHHSEKNHADKIFTDEALEAEAPKRRGRPPKQAEAKA
jgi:hypothetical protein